MAFAWVAIGIGCVIGAAVLVAVGAYVYLTVKENR